jgi:predicted nucleic acid-binding protein
MSFGNLQTGDAVFLDANILIYHFTNHPQYGMACTLLIERIERKELRGFTSAHCLADVTHRLMTLEAKSKLNWPDSRLAARLKKYHAEIPSLRHYQQATAKVGQLGIRVLPVVENHILTANALSQQFELLTGDALIIALMQQHGLTNLASEDADFDRVPGITRYAPS